MKLPNWFKILWWCALTGVISLFLYKRYPDLISGHTAAVDVFAFAVWVALLLVPLFTEVSFLGIKFKQEIEKVREALSAQISDVRNDIKNAVDIRTTFSPQINFPPSDSKLPEIEERIKKVIADELSARGSHVFIDEPELNLHPDTVLLFSMRYAIEREITRISENYLTSQVSYTMNPQKRFVPIQRTIRSLVERGIIDEQLEHAIREVYAVCSPAIHGAEVTPAQLSFVKDVGPGLLKALRLLH